MTADPDIWSLVDDERAALAADLADLPDGRWATPSLCDGFTVRDVVAHLTANASLGPVRWMAGVIRCRFDFDRMVAMRLREQLGASPSETLDRFRQVRTSRRKAPVPTVAVLGEVIVHGEDIRRPLGLHRDYPVPALAAVAGFYQGSDLVVPSRRRIQGLQLAATDSDFAVGAGPLVEGSTLALVMAMTGRRVYADELEGPGAARLR